MSSFQVSATDETVKINNVHPVAKKTLKSLKLQITFKQTMKQPRQLCLKSFLQFLGVQPHTKPPYHHGMPWWLLSPPEVALPHVTTSPESIGGNVAQFQPQVVWKKNREDTKCERIYRKSA